MLKIIVVAVPLLLGGAYVSGALGGAGGYSRVVDRSPAEVAAALQDLDITQQPGAPGTDPSRSGGVRSLFTHERTANGITWTVHSGDKVAVTMMADLEPVDGGKRTRVTAHVARGDAPDDFVAPAFRSTGLTMGLFGMALEDDLNHLVAPPAADAKTCQELFDRFRDANMAAGEPARPAGLSEALANGARLSMRLSAMHAEARRAGCADTAPGEGAFRPVEARMGPAEPRPSDGIRFEPGKPMLDPDPDHHH